MFSRLYHDYIFPITRLSRSAQLYLTMVVINGIIFSGWSLFFNFYMLGSGHNKEFLGLINSAPSMAALIFGLPIGLLSDRLGRKGSILISIIISSVAMVAQITAKGPAVIVGMGFIIGVSNMLFIVSQAPLLMKLSSKEDRLLLFSLNAGFQTLAGAVGSLFAGQLPGFFGGLLSVQADSASAYQAVLLFTVAAGTLSLIPMFMVQEPRLSEEKIQGKQHTTFGWDVIRITLRLSTPNVLIGFGAAILIPYANVFFREKFNTSDNTLGFMFSLAALITGMASIVGPRLATWLGGKIRTVVTTQAISLVFLEMMGFAPWQSVAVTSFLVRGALMNMSAPLYSAFVMEQVDEHHQGTVNSITSLAWNIGWAVGPFLSGVVQERYGFAPLFITTGVLYFTAVLLTWVLFRRTETRD